MKIKVPVTERDKLLQIIKEDAYFLASINIIDYSLLVGIIDNDEIVQSNGLIVDMSRVSMQSVMVKDMTPKKMYRVESSDSKYTFLMGIIDTTTYYGLKKKGEAMFKRLFQGDGVSCTDPIRYAKRFSDFLNEQFV